MGHNFDSFKFLIKIYSPIGKLVINGPHCKVPDFKPTSLKNLKVKKTKRLKPCHSVKKQQRSLTAIMSSTRVEDPLFIKIHEKHFSDYGVSNASCCYHTTKREKNSDMKIKLHGECKEFQNNHEIDKKYQTLFIQCSSGGKVIYSIPTFTQSSRRNKNSSIVKKRQKLILLKLTKCFLLALIPFQE